MKMPTNPENAAKRGPKAAWLWARRKWAYLKQITVIEDGDDYDEPCSLCEYYVRKNHCIDCGLKCQNYIYKAETAYLKGNLTAFLKISQHMYDRIVAKGIELGYWEK